MKKVIIVLGITLIGALAGYGYYYFIGCNTGNTCPITNNPVSSMGYGALLGGIVSLNFLPSKKKS